MDLNALMRRTLLDPLDFLRRPRPMPGAARAQLCPHPACGGDGAFHHGDLGDRLTNAKVCGRDGAA